jgi:mannobiose 2-epimerase
MNNSYQVSKLELINELTNIFSYWIDYSIDDENGGFVGEISYDNKVKKNSKKSVVLNTRILWAFSSAYIFNPKPEYLEMAKRAYDYILKYFWDAENGGVYWEIDSNGNPLNTNKIIYGQGFALYGFSEFYKATGNKESLEYSIKIFELIEKYSYDSIYGGYIEAFSKEWKVINSIKTMNTHLHIIEPYTNLYCVWKNELLGKKLKDLIYVFLEKIIDPKSQNFNLVFKLNWEILSNEISYGHDIEGTWLLNEAAQVYGDESLINKVKEITIKMSDKVLENGIDFDGSIFYEFNKSKNHLNTDKHWWAQAEGMVGFLNSYQITKDQKYLQEFEKLWEFIKNNIIDKKNGEWFRMVRKDGTICKIDPKVSFWKCPYHNSRALIEVIKRLQTIQSNI